ncbi:MAG: hypothetical protein J6A73_04685 [Lachnospiraceae bacterium]|nr:hypothetical protein [Lachnospiraceae bacterium]
MDSIYDIKPDDERPARSWFLVYNNPQEIITYKVDSNKNPIRDDNNNFIILDRQPSQYAGLSPEELCDKMLELWCNDSDSRTGACAYSISAEGLHHLHIVCEDDKPFRWTEVKKVYPKAHIEPTRGNKKQAEDYIYKRGKYAEKGEQTICIRFHGEIKGAQGQRTDLLDIGQYIENGLRPKEILDKDIRYYKHENIIRAAYYRKREKETPILRDLSVHYHVGLAGSGKSYSYVSLSNDNPDDVFLVNDYSSGFLDDYNGESILFLDEFRGQIPFTLLLCLLQGYKQQFHARYRNITGLWTEVHITSVIPPERLYSKMVCENKEYDTYEQLRRRMTDIVYHYKDKDEQYKQCIIPITEYISYNEMVSWVMGKELKDGYMQLTDEEYKYTQMMFGGLKS